MPIHDHDEYNESEEIFDILDEQSKIKEEEDDHDDDISITTSTSTTNGCITINIISGKDDVNGNK